MAWRKAQSGEAAFSDSFKQDPAWWNGKARQMIFNDAAARQDQAAAEAKAGERSGVQNAGSKRSSGTARPTPPPCSQLPARGADTKVASLKGGGWHRQAHGISAREWRYRRKLKMV